jgi:hypothetical protein
VAHRGRTAVPAGHVVLRGRSRPESTKTGPAIPERVKSLGRQRDRQTCAVERTGVCVEKTIGEEEAEGLMRVFTPPKLGPSAQSHPILPAHVMSGGPVARVYQKSSTG